MALTDYVIMPGEDYQAICDAVREKRNEIEVIKSGEIAGKIQGIEAAPKLQDKNVIPTTETHTVTADEGYDGLYSVTVTGDADLKPENVREGVNIFGVEGTVVEGEPIDELARFIGETRVALANGIAIDDEYHTRVIEWQCDHMFSRCSSLTTVPLFDTSRVLTMKNMFFGCSSLTTVPLFDTSSATSMMGMFSNCSSLTTVPLFDTSRSKDMMSMFSNCSSLTTVPPFDIRSVKSSNGTASIVHNCNNLTNCYLRNIKVDLQVGSGTTYGHLLTLDSLIHLIYECRDTGSLKTLTVGSANLEKLANVYVRTIKITDEMRAEDDLIDEKLPFEVCESTDEGAMLIVDYAVEKNWSIK